MAGTLKPHCFNALRYNRCFNLSWPFTHTGNETRVLFLSDYPRKEKFSPLPIFNVSHVNVLLDHYRACLYTLYLPEQLCPPGINNESRALQLTTWGCFPIITPCSGLPAFHFSMFICAQQMPSLPIHQWTSRRVYVAALRVLTLDPWVTYSMGTEVYFASGCESLNLLECY